LSDGKGHLFQGVYLGKIEGKFWVEVLTLVKEEERLQDLRIWQSVLHSPTRMDWLVEKLTEIGASEIGFFSAQRSGDINFSVHKQVRWEKIVVNACKQSGRLFFPTVRYRESWKDLLETLRAFSGRIIVADLSAEEDLWYFLNTHGESCSFLLVVGPEGDFTEKEKEELLSFPRAYSVRLTSHILRSETASLFGASILRSFLDGRS